MNIASLADDCWHAKGIASVWNILYDHGVCSNDAIISNANWPKKYSSRAYLYTIPDSRNAILAITPFCSDCHILINMTVLTKNRVLMNHASYTMMLKACPPTQIPGLMAWLAMIYEIFSIPRASQWQNAFLPYRRCAAFQNMSIVFHSISRQDDA